MFELSRSPKTNGSIPSLPVSLRFRPITNQRISGRQACAAGLRNAASRRVNRGRLALLFALKIPQAARRCRLHLHDDITDSRST